MYMGAQPRREGGGGGGGGRVGEQNKIKITSFGCVVVPTHGRAMRVPPISHTGGDSFPVLQRHPSASPIDSLTCLQKMMQMCCMYKLLQVS